jgi:hypothetical protein
MKQIDINTVRKIFSEHLPNEDFSAQYERTMEAEIWCVGVDDSN